MKTIIISPFAQNLRNGKENSKNFPYWIELVKLMKDAQFNIIQIGSFKDKPIEGVTEFKQSLSFEQIKELINTADTWISVDSFLQHLNHYYSRKQGIVIFAQSDPRIFGYNENTNMLKHRSYLRDKQFWLWEQTEYDKNAFVTAEEVFNTLLKVLELK